MKQRNIITGILLLIFLTLILSGCWNRRELDTLAIVSGVAMDKAEEADQIKITVQVIKPGEIRSTSKSEEDPFINVTETGVTTFATFRKMLLSSSRKFFYAHDEIIILGQELAQGGARKYLDIFFRDHELRLTIYLLVSKGRADDVLQEKAYLDKIPAIEIAKIVKGSMATSIIPNINLKKFVERLLSKTTAPIAPIIFITGEGNNKKAHVAGTAVFKQDKLIGELDPLETRGLLWVMGEVKSGIIEVDSPQGEGKESLEIKGADKKIIPEIKNGQIYINIKVREEGHLGDQMSSEDYSKLSAWNALEERQAAAIENEIRAAFKKAQELNADIFGFGDAVHRQYPKEWRELESQWDEVFPTLQLNISIEAKLRRPGKTIKPASLEEEK